MSLTSYMCGSYQVNHKNANWQKGLKVRRIENVCRLGGKAASFFP